MTPYWHPMPASRQRETRWLCAVGAFSLTLLAVAWKAARIERRQLEHVR